jgi:four helix bundle protein
MLIQSFQDIKAWQKSHALVLEVYNLTASYPKAELFALVSQSRRAAVSIPSNIAEGFRRNGKNDTLHFYNIAQASLEELRYQLLLAKDLKYIEEKDYQKIILIAEDTSKILSGWIKSKQSRD